MPDITTILRREGDKEIVIGRILWHWPSQELSMIELGGETMRLSEFLRRGEGLLNTDTNVMFGTEQFTWKSAIGRPAQVCCVFYTNRYYLE